MQLPLCFCRQLPGRRTKRSDHPLCWSIFRLEENVSCTRVCYFPSTPASKRRRPAGTQPISQHVDKSRQTRFLREFCLASPLSMFLMQTLFWSSVQWPSNDYQPSVSEIAHFVWMPWSPSFPAFKSRHISSPLFSLGALFENLLLSNLVVYRESSGELKSLWAKGSTNWGRLKCAKESGQMFWFL